MENWPTSICVSLILLDKYLTLWAWTSKSFLGANLTFEAHVYSEISFKSVGTLHFVIFSLTACKWKSQRYPSALLGFSGII